MNKTITLEISKSFYKELKHFIFMMNVGLFKNIKKKKIFSLSNQEVTVLILETLKMRVLNISHRLIVLENILFLY